MIRYLGTHAETITYAELVAKRDAGTLIEGMQYRITDYTCTVNSALTNVQSAGNVFDIIVTADSNNTINENARAIQHDGDTYFANNNLEAWVIKYALDNDTSRFSWADATTGKGVIFYMQDEFNNTLSYDFKNIQYKRWNITSVTTAPSTFVGKYYAFQDSAHNGVTPDTADSIFCYTFTGLLTNNDASLSAGTHSNCVGFYKDGSNVSTLNNNVFFGDSTQDNKLGIYCINNTFGDNCNSNTTGNSFIHNILGRTCVSNAFGGGVGHSTFGDEVFSNIFKGQNNYINYNNKDVTLFVYPLVTGSTGSVLDLSAFIENTTNFTPIPSSVIIGVTDDKSKFYFSRVKTDGTTEIKVTI